MEEIAALLLVDQARQRYGLTAPRPNLHMCFTGAPGTGKTTVALRMAELLHRLGYLQSATLVHAMRDDLVGEYIGQTAPKTHRVLDRAMGGVLFIDEAYYLYRTTDSKDYGQEAIDILLQVMENSRGDLVVILAGYKDRMDVFFESNPGMRSRIAHHLDFASYDIDELSAIGAMMLERSAYYLSPAAEQALRAEVRPDDDRAALRQRPHRAQLARAGAAAARAPGLVRPAPRVDQGRPHAPGAGRHPRASMRRLNPARHSERGSAAVAERRAQLAGKASASASAMSWPRWA